MDTDPTTSPSKPPPPAPMPTPAVPPAATFQTPVFVRPEKNMVLALLLTFFLGSLGMLYATIPGGILLTLIGGPLLFLTGGIAGFVIWPIQLLWTFLAVRNHNKQIRTHWAQATR